MVYLVGDKQGHLLETLLKDRHIIYRSYIGQILPSDLCLTEDDVLFFIGSMVQYKALPENLRNYARFISKTKTKPDHLLSVVNNLEGTVASTGQTIIQFDDVSKIDIESMQKSFNVVYEFQLDGKQLFVVPDNINFVPDNEDALVLTFVEFLPLYYVLSRVHNVSSCKICPFT